MNGGILGLEVQIMVYMTMVLMLTSLARTEEAKNLLGVAFRILVILLVILALVGMITQR